MTAAIRLEGVGKRFRLGTEPTLAGRVRRTRGGEGTRDLWALREVDLQVAEGETVGVIGRNGSGKTTLLRLLSGVSAPTEGRLRVTGSIAPLIGVGVGFHPEMTGRENVHVNGRLLGLSAAQVRERFDAIVDFSEIASFLDTPVKFYSSGMFLRLAFAVAVHVRPRVLLVDEVLAVGDLAFQLKCVERMREVQQEGTTVVVVTHNLQLLDRLAPRGVVLQRGRVAYDGPVDGALSAYHRALDLGGAAGEPAADEDAVEVEVELLDAAGALTSHALAGEPVRARVTARFAREVQDPVVGVMVSPLGLGAAYAVHAPAGGYRGVHGPGRPLHADVTLDNRLLDGSYALHVGVHDATGGRELGRSAPTVFYVSSPASTAFGIVDLQARLVVEGQELVDPGRRRLGE